MSDESQEPIRIVRGAIESLVEPDVAAKVLFKALESPDVDGIPTTRETVLDFVRGALTETLTQRLGASVAQHVQSTVERHLGSGPTVSEEPQTVAFAEAVGPVKLLVVASSSRLSDLLKGTLGTDRVTVMSIDDPGAVSALAGPLSPDVIIVDGSEPSGASSTAVADAVSDHPTAQLLIVWSSEQAHGMDVSQALESRGQAHVPVASLEGMDPLLDYIRSRFGDQY